MQPVNIVTGDAWQGARSGASVGILCMHPVRNPASDPSLQTRKETLIEGLRQRYQGYDRTTLRELPTLAAYHQFYRQFKKTYHLQLQLESILSGKGIPSVAGLVEAMFMAELEDHLLTAGHNLDSVHPPLVIDISDGTQTYTRMNGQTQTLKHGDLFIRDQVGVLSSVIYGPDQRTRIQQDTQSVLFTTYGVPGITKDDLRVHLEKLQEYVCLISPDASVVQQEIVGS